MIGTNIFQEGKHHDWTTVVLNPKKQIDTKKVSKQQSHTTSQNNKQGGNQSINVKKVSEETEDFHHKKVSKDIAQSIISARCSRKLTQEGLAKALNMPQKDISDIETCKAIYNGGQLAKIKRFLNIN